MSWWSKKNKRGSLDRGVVRKPAGVSNAHQEDEAFDAERNPDFGDFANDGGIFGDGLKSSQASGPLDHEHDDQEQQGRRSFERGSDEETEDSIAEILSAEETRGSKRKGKGKRKKNISDAEDAELVERLSARVLIDFLPAMIQQDAIEMARHTAQNYLTNPSNGYFIVLPYEGGFAYEVQEGVGQSYLASVLELSMNNPGRLVIVPMVRRVMTIVYTSRSNDFEAQILNEGIEPPQIAGAMPLYAVRGAAMVPIMKQHVHWLISGMIMAGIGGVALLGSIMFFALDPKAKIPAQWRVTDVAQLPVLQWTSLQTNTGDTYVSRLEYTGNSWRIVRQSATAELDVLDVEDSGTANINAAGSSGSQPQVGPADGSPSNLPPQGAVGPSLPQRAVAPPLPQRAVAPPPSR